MLLCVNSRGCFRLVLLINQAFIIILEKLFIMLRMASRVKTFLVLLCITGACIVCFHQVLVPVTSSKIGKFGWCTLSYEFKSFLLQNKN